MGWLTGWAYRKSHIINPASGADQNYQKRIVAHFGFGVDDDENVYLNGNCKADFGDPRFTDNTGIALLDYWIEEKVDSSYAIYWVEIRDDLSVYDRRIYIYYSNSGAVSIANGDTTFIFFDDFEVNLSKWTVFGSPTLSTDQAYSGIKSVKVPPLATTILHGWTTPPTGNKAAHVHFYDELSPLTECAMFSIDSGESEASFIGIVNDVAQYEYTLDSIQYNSGVDRTIGWHTFVARSSENLKQFIIDGTLMPVTGKDNYCPDVHILGFTLSQVSAYWDAVFVTKFVNPEPSHGAWGAEENEAGTSPTLFVAEDVENSISGTPLVLEEMIYYLNKKSLDTEDVLIALPGGPPHVAKLYEDIIISLLVNRRILTVEDLTLDLSGSPHVPISYEEMIMDLLAKRTYKVQPDFIERIGAFPIFGGSHVIQVKGEEE
jgi:hypothetical protein